MNIHQKLIRDVADLNEAVVEPLTAEGFSVMLALLDQIKATAALMPVQVEAPQ